MEKVLFVIIYRGQEKFDKKNLRSISINRCKISKEIQ